MACSITAVLTQVGERRSIKQAGTHRSVVS
jgi:hypothetical protein